MNIIKKIISVIFCVALCISVSANLYAENTAPTIKVSNVEAMPDETVTVDISISNNPGIMVMSFAITYDNSVLEYDSYKKGYISNCTVKNHANKGYVAFLNDETKDLSENGNIISVSFKVKSNAKSGRYYINLENSNRSQFGSSLKNSFSNSKLNYVIPTVISGSVKVGETCKNDGHKYGDWKITKPADCKNTGTKEHKCLRCEYTETETIPITHDFENEWTVDRVATPEIDGIMSRHCKNCDAVTDEIKFTYKEVESSQTPDNSSKDENNSDTEIGNSNQNDNSSVAETEKTPIINIENSKNPLSAVENTEDYQQNIKPNITDTNESNGENITSESQTEDTVSYDTNSSDTVKTDSDQKDTPIQKSNGKIVLIIIIATILIITATIAILFIVKRKKIK